MTKTVPAKKPATTATEDTWRQKVSSLRCEILKWIYAQIEPRMIQTFGGPKICPWYKNGGLDMSDPDSKSMPAPYGYCVYGFTHSGVVNSLDPGIKIFPYDGMETAELAAVADLISLHAADLPPLPKKEESK